MVTLSTLDAHGGVTSGLAHAEKFLCLAALALIGLMASCLLLGTNEFRKCSFRLVSSLFHALFSLDEYLLVKNVSSESLLMSGCGYRITNLHKMA